MSLDSASSQTSQSVFWGLPLALAAGLLPGLLWAQTPQPAPMAEPETAQDSPSPSASESSPLPGTEDTETPLDPNLGESAPASPVEQGTSEQEPTAVPTPAIQIVTPTPGANRKDVPPAISTDQAGQGIILTSKGFLGSPVFHDEERLGTLEDILLNPQTGQIEYGILATENFLGLEDKKVVVLWKDLVVAKAQSRVLTRIDAASLEAAPEYQGQDSFAPDEVPVINRVQVVMEPVATKAMEESTPLPTPTLPSLDPDSRSPFDADSSVEESGAILSDREIEQLDAAAAKATIPPDPNGVEADVSGSESNSSEDPNSAAVEGDTSQPAGTAMDPNSATESDEEPPATETAGANEKDVTSDESSSGTPVVEESGTTFGTSTTGGERGSSVPEPTGLPVTPTATPTVSETPDMTPTPTMPREDS